jgi:DNA polymerase-3 subunit gamma/tau
MVFYLKYRPKKISDLDSAELRGRLEAILAGKLPDDIPHAFLFTGPKGLGKTSTARIVAKAINCTNRKGKEIEPCNICSSCKSINSGSSLDVIELDGASNRGIDEIRDLREKIRLAPISSKKKIYIIDEVHMLTTEAFNALLKTLEEPPSHAVFILCTTEPQKVPATITSRCFHVKFQRATNEDLIHSFGRILKGEGLKADPDALLEVAALSDGSFRDGAKILEDLSSANHITVQVIEKKFKTQTLSKNLESLISAFAEKDAKSGIKIIDSLAREGIDFKLLTESLINRLHASLVSQIEGESFPLSLADTKKLLEKLIGAHMSLRYAVLPQLPLELLIVEWSSQGDEESGIEDPEPSVPQDRNSAPAKMTSQIASEDDKILVELRDKIKGENFSIAALLRDSKVKEFDGKKLSIAAKIKFHKEKLSEPDTIKLLEENLKDMTKKNIKVNIV